MSKRSRKLHSTVGGAEHDRRKKAGNHGKRAGS
jgi:hypothetical protein